MGNFLVIRPGLLFAASLIATFMSFAFIGMMRGKVTNIPKLRTSTETVMLGIVAASLAFICGTLLEKIIK